MEQQWNVFQIKWQGKTPEEQLCEVEIGNLPEKEFRIMIVKMIQDLRRRMEARIKKMKEMFNRDLEELKNKQRWTIQCLKWKNILEGINSRIIEVKEWISDLIYIKKKKYIYIRKTYNN